MGIQHKMIQRNSTAAKFLEFVRHFSPTKGAVNSIVADLTTKYVRSSKEQAFKDGIIFSGRVARFFLDQVDKLKSENTTLRSEISELKQELLFYRQKKTKEGDLEEENKNMSES